MAVLCPGVLVAILQHGSISWNINEMVNGLNSLVKMCLWMAWDWWLNQSTKGFKLHIALVFGFAPNRVWNRRASTYLKCQWYAICFWCFCLGTPLVTGFMVMCFLINYGFMFVQRKWIQRRGHALGLVFQFMFSMWIWTSSLCPQICMFCHH